jgi:hypothetical protein
MDRHIGDLVDLALEPIGGVPNVAGNPRAQRKSPRPYPRGSSSQYESCTLIDDLRGSGILRNARGRPISHALQKPQQRRDI